MLVVSDDTYFQSVKEVEIKGITQVGFKDRTASLTLQVDKISGTSEANLYVKAAVKLKLGLGTSAVKLKVTTYVLEGEGFF